MMQQYLFGWGCASDGQLGEAGCDVLTPRPVASLPPLPIITVAPGLWSSLIVTSEAIFTASCGSNKPNTLQRLPGAHPPLSTIVSAAGGRDFNLLLTAHGTIYAFGSGAYGELGLGSMTTAVVPTRIGALEGVKIVSVVAAEFHWLALDATGAVFSCGNNASGQLGLRHSNPVSTPTRVTALWPHPIVAISTGDGHSAALSASGCLFCFGSNKYGQLGNSSFRVCIASLTPTPVPIPSMQGDVSYSVSKGRGAGGTESESDIGQAMENGRSALSRDRYIDVACGSAHTVALRGDGMLVCWGKGEHGQLGSRVTRSLYEPTVVITAARFVAVSAGEWHSAAMTGDGRLFMWGDGSSGQLGDGDKSSKYFPVVLRAPHISAVASPLKFLRVHCGGFHTLALVGGERGAVYDAGRVNASRGVRCVVDNMLQSKAGLSRFGSASVLLRTFVRDDVSQVSEGIVDYVAAETAHLQFMRTFRNDGKRILRVAAAMIRHQAQISFGMVRSGERVAFGEEEGLGMSLLTSKGDFSMEEEDFRISVANSRHVGYVFLLALMNPTYGESDCVAELAELAAVLLRCEGDGRVAFVELVSFCEEGVLLNRIIRPLQAVVTVELNKYRRITRNAIFATKMLALCFHGIWQGSKRNKMRDVGVYRREFYNEAVSELVNFAEDYDRWLKATGSVRGGQSSRDDDSMQAYDIAGNSASHGPAPRHHDDCDGSNGSEGCHIGGHPEMEGSPSNDANRSGQDGGADSVVLPPLPVAGQSDGAFSFCQYSFLLSEAAKFKILELESQRTMNKETVRSFLSFGALQTPSVRLSSPQHIRVPAGQMAQLQFLMLQVRRSHIVSDTFIQIAELAQNHPRELRKPLRVRFVGEEGVDEGGVSKEFYQVLLDHILSPEYGMFVQDEENHFHWFRKDFLEPDSSWTLIGIMFGLAAFNSILLDVQFPPVVYRKLAIALRKKGSYVADLGDVKETFPSIGNSLQHLKDYDGDDIEDTFMLSFEITNVGLFDKVEQVELVPNGANVPVSKNNRDRFVELYGDYLINQSIERAFSAFETGFAFMLAGPFVKQLSGEELETLVVGEKQLDFGMGGLRQAAVYEGGYREDSTIIIQLWQVLDEFDEDLKRLFLSFVTGTDRAPIGGLIRLKLIIQRAGPDTNRLPTSYTCFNVLLLPEYNTRAKLRDRLLTAIANSKGFGLQ